MIFPKYAKDHYYEYHPNAWSFGVSTSYNIQGSNEPHLICDLCGADLYYENEFRLWVGKNFCNIILWNEKGKLYLPLNKKKSRNLRKDKNIINAKFTVIKS